MRRPRLAWTAILSLFLATPLAALRVFVTSYSGTADLGSWIEAGPAFGIDAGDAICQWAVNGANLPGEFRAWLSTPTNDAYCRVHDLPGTKADNCGGQPQLTAAAGPWYVNDGLFPIVFASEIPLLLAPSYEVFNPPRFDEYNAVVHGRYWTGTNTQGVSSDGACGEWISASNDVFTTVGVSDGTGQAFTTTGGSTTNCGADNHLLCVQIGVGLPFGPGHFFHWGRLAFVTSSFGKGKLEDWPEALAATGVAAGNQICRTLAQNAGLPEPQSFKAWLSTSTVDARDRISFDGPWMRLDRQRIANHLADLTDGYLRTSLNVTETGAYITGNVWTGTNAAGNRTQENCQDWMSDVEGHYGEGGRADHAGAAWTENATPSLGCAAGRRLYCLQDLPLIFGDGFESGSTLTWTFPFS